MTSWEQRMAAKAHAVQEERLAVERSTSAREAAVVERRLRAEAGDYYDRMTLGEAVAELDRLSRIACACVGGPFCCIRRADHARLLIRAGHMAVKLVDGLAARRFAEDFGR